MAEGRFVFVYHEDLIANHSPIWDDDKALATWVRLLALADKMWPSPAELPRGANKPAVDRLIGAGLIESVGPHRYHIPSLDKKRTAASNAASNAARIRHGTAASNAQSLPTIRRPDTDVDTDQTRGMRASGPMAEELAEIYDRATGNDPIPVDVRRLQKLAADLTGDAFVNIHAGLGLKATKEQLPHGFDRVESAWRQVDVRVRAASGPNVKPTLRQLVFGADELLNIVPKPEATEVREEQGRRDFDRRVKNTQRLIEEYR